METQRRQKTSNEGFPAKVRVEPQSMQEAPSVSAAAKRQRNDADEYGLLERILEPDNLNRAYKRVKANKGAPGVDQMTVDVLLPYLKAQGEAIRQAVFQGHYIPQPVRRAEIDKPGGGTRELGIPTVTDRLLQQAMVQQLSPLFEAGFSEHSYGFRPKRDAKQAVRAAQTYISKGYSWVVDIDLARYFDTVNHDKLMALIARKVGDKRVLTLIRAYLNSGIMINGVAIESVEGVPQGGPLSPLLSNVMLDELDKELEKRGHKFCRYADDCNIYVKSRRAAERVMQSISAFLEETLKLKVNREKSAVDRPWKRKFLGFSFYSRKGGVGIRVHTKSIARFKAEVREILSRNNGKSTEQKLAMLTRKIVGWVNYFAIADMKNVAAALDEWMRRRMRMCIWKQWRKISTRLNNLLNLGFDRRQAWMFANTRKGYWRVSNSPILKRSFTNEYLVKLGFVSVSLRYSLVRSS
jgi:group II intron reverse transcriptase/maturase